MKSRNSWRYSTAIPGPAGEQVQEAAGELRTLAVPDLPGKELGPYGHLAADRQRRDGGQVALKLLSLFVTVPDFGEAGGIYYIAIELVEGRTLRQVIASESLRAARRSNSLRGN